MSRAFHGAHTGCVFPTYGRPGRRIGALPDMLTPSPYLEGLAARAAASHFGPHTEVSITLRHHGSNVRAASSSAGAARCDQVESRQDVGPCILAMQQLHAVLVPDVGTEERWNAWCAQATREGFVSAVAMPAHVAPGLDLAVNLYSAVTDPWDARALVEADHQAQRAAEAVALRVKGSEPVALRAVDDAMRAHATIEQAVGAVMQGNGCDADEALAFLLSASTRGKATLEDVATSLLRSLTGTTTSAPPRPRDAPVDLA